MVLVIALVDDLMFLSRIQEVARRYAIPEVNSGIAMHQGVTTPQTPGLTIELLFLNNSSALLSACRERAPDLILADLSSPRLAAVDAIRNLYHEFPLMRISAVGFYAHMDVEKAQEAQAAGYDQVMTRGVFFRELPRLLGSLVKNEVRADQTFGCGGGSSQA